eukprot:TRINITY_DN33775_c0_g1_i1.p1 TRINITY_DN33775_c0_g1~~TRINITY_DN33775_c0_g1_i1.p1  ORF type:complete len:455 (+),score=88.58 TRINITY_DN33775_c0_g1_i1:54-1367(+)
MSDFLRGWVESKGCRIKPEVVTKKLPEMGGGVGVVVTADVPPGTVVASVPMTMMLTTRCAREHVVFRHIYDDTISPLGLIPLFLAHEDRDENSAWHPWVSRLPQAYDTLLEATDDEIKILTASRRRHSKVLEERKALDALYQETLAIIKNKAIPSSLPKPDRLRLEALKKLKFKEFRKFYCSLLSRGFYHSVNERSNDIWAMIPWLDYFNYTDCGGHNAEFIKQRQRFEVTTASTCPAGSQILLKYGTYSNYELLLWYGFVLDRNRNLEYKFSPMSDANGNVSSDTVWLMEMFDSLLGMLELIPWATPQSLSTWKTTGIGMLTQNMCLEKWSIYPCKGYHKGVGLSLEAPPKVSQNMKESIALLVGMLQMKSDFVVAQAQFLKAIVSAELSTQWSPVASPLKETHTSQAVTFMLEEERGFLKNLDVMELDVWVAALQ